MTNIGQILIGVRSWTLFFACLVDELPTDSLRCSLRSLVLLVWLAGIPPIHKPASREITSASVELCETEICSSTTNLLARKCDLRKCRQLRLALLCCVSQITILLVLKCLMNGRDQTRLTFVTSLFTDHKQISQYEPNTHISEQFVSRQ